MGSNPNLRNTYNLCTQVKHSCLILSLKISLNIFCNIFSRYSIQFRRIGTVSMLASRLLHFSSEKLAVALLLVMSTQNDCVVLAKFKLLKR